MINVAAGLALRGTTARTTRGRRWAQRALARPGAHADRPCRHAGKHRLRRQRVSPPYLQAGAAAAHCWWNASAVADECALAGHRSRDAPRHANVPLGVLSWAYRPMRMSRNSAPRSFAAMRWNGGYVFHMPMDRIIGDAARNALAVHNRCRIGNSYERLRIH